jgi:alpha-beta hydrolase superfamily lysophospholipase
MFGNEHMSWPIVVKLGVAQMQESTFVFSAPDGTQIFVYRWFPQDRPAAVVQIVHGLAEHAARYRRLAEALANAGFASFGCDLRGHGRTVRTADELGFFAESEGWRKCLEDLCQLNQIISAEHPGVPVVMLGHSLGATLVRQLLIEYGDALAGAVLSGSSGQPTPLALAGRAIARAEKLRLGARGKSALIRTLTFESFNKRFQPARTKFDWLSRDPAEVDKYAADPLCGFTPSVQLWIDLLDAWHDIAKSCTGIPKNLPVYVISGTHDPVSAGTRMLEPMLAQYRAAGLKVEHRFYPAARHELLNETNRDEVTTDLIKWIARALSARSVTEPAIQS